MDAMGERKPLSNPVWMYGGLTSHHEHLKPFFKVVTVWIGLSTWMHKHTHTYIYIYNKHLFSSTVFMLFPVDVTCQ